jgi:hypothetical protein
MAQSPTFRISKHYTVPYSIYSYVSHDSDNNNNIGNVGRRWEKLPPGKLLCGGYAENHDDFYWIYYRTYLVPDLTDLTEFKRLYSSACIESAVISIHHAYHEGDGFFIWPLFSDNPFPPAVDAQFCKIPSLSEPGTVDVDISNIFKMWWDNLWPNNGFLIVSPFEVFSEPVSHLYRFNISDIVLTLK